MSWRLPAAASRVGNSGAPRGPSAGRAASIRNRRAVLAVSAAGCFSVYTFDGHRPRSALGTWRSTGSGVFSDAWAVTGASGALQTVFQEGWSARAGLYRLRPRSRADGRARLRTPVARDALPLRRRINASALRYTPAPGPRPGGRGPGARPCPVAGDPPFGGSGTPATTCLGRAWTGTHRDWPASPPGPADRAEARRRRTGRRGGWRVRWTACRSPWPCAMVRRLWAGRATGWAAASRGPTSGSRPPSAGSGSAMAACGWPAAVSTSSAGCTSGRPTAPGRLRRPSAPRHCLRARRWPQAPPGPDHAGLPRKVPGAARTGRPAASSSVNGLAAPQRA
jgi:hypothetical protein